MRTIEARNLVAGDWVGSPSRERWNPARADDLVTLTAEADADLVDRALSEAVIAQRDWATTPAPARGQILMRAADVLEGESGTVAADLTREEGKTLAEATGEVRRAAAILRFFGSEGWRLGGETFPSATRDVEIHTRREPIGVVLSITPWNFPIAIPAWKIAPALVAGNAVVLKPAGLTPGTATHLVRALADAGLPPGILTLLLGEGATVGMQLVDDRRIGAISFTGSVDVGGIIYERAAPRRPRVQLEMGGKNALVVLDDADPEVAARLTAAAGFGLTGQACTATSRVICQRGIAPRFVDALIEESKRYAPGDGLAPGVLMGPVVSTQQLATDRMFLELARAEGIRIVVGDGIADGLLQDPVVLTEVRPDHRLAQEEVFGPVISVIEVDDLTEAIDVVNGTRFGLTAGIVTAHLGAAMRFAREARVGVVKVNQPTTGVELNVPFGGVGESSTNTYREQGSAAVDFFSWTKSVYVTPPSWS